MTSSGSSTARLRGADLAYDRSGVGSPPMLWAHGLTQSRSTESVYELLDFSRLPVQVIRADARGHGDSSTTPVLRNYNWDELAADQLALAHHLNVDTYIAAGASMGCGTALHAAVLAPERVARCVLVIPPTAWEARRERAAEWKRLAGIVEQQGVDPLIAARADQPPPDPFADDHELRARQEWALRAWDPRRLATVFRGAAEADLPARELIRTISTPCLVLAWTGDAVHPEATAHELHALLPHSQLHIASTLPELRRWTDIVADFIAP